MLYNVLQGGSTCVGRYLISSDQQELRKIKSKACKQACAALTLGSAPFDLTRLFIPHRPVYFCNQYAPFSLPEQTFTLDVNVYVRFIGDDKPECFVSIQ